MHIDNVTSGDMEGNMVPLVVLTVSFLLGLSACAAGFRFVPDWRAAMDVALAIMFITTASAHWGRLRADLVRMVPPQLKWPESMVTMTGILEIAGAVGLLLSPTRRVAALSLIILLVAMLPANVYAARAGLHLGGKPVMPLRWRIPLQVLFIICLALGGK